MTTHNHHDLRAQAVEAIANYLHHRIFDHVPIWPSGDGLATAVKRYHTPTVNDSKNCTLPPSQVGRKSLIGDLMRDGENGNLNPAFVEWLMGYPIGWTELQD